MPKPSQPAKPRPCTWCETGTYAVYCEPQDVMRMKNFLNVPQPQDFTVLRCTNTECGHVALFHRFRAPS